MRKSNHRSGPCTVSPGTFRGCRNVKRWTWKLHAWPRKRAKDVRYNCFYLEEGTRCSRTPAESALRDNHLLIKFQEAIHGHQATAGHPGNKNNTERYRTEKKKKIWDVNVLPSTVGSAWPEWSCSSFSILWTTLSTYLQDAKPKLKKNGCSASGHFLMCRQKQNSCMRRYIVHHDFATLSPSWGYDMECI